ncbi:zinc carboxypeptidase [Chitinimonas arctica]|uniref:Zinc carboxypeptidase n=1 Tax=Chitinimonas arctica TaxID=2594795 RepID=A0A516SG47_9NEIS|nr:M14 family zinc carboxypeptidase [Chitinimonas arctica]QDQ27139.1 zinc carboxypeptidase [Chitinimonas arctica]
MPRPPLAELIALERLVKLGEGRLQARTVTEVRVGKTMLPVLALSLGSQDADAPIVGFFGGVHGLERIGTQVLLAFMHNLLMRLRWDSTLEYQLDHMRLLFMPLVNPGGMLLHRRANPAGIDLMRNAPLDATDPVAWLLGGHRLSAALPWYRGPVDQPMQAESAALCQVVTEEMLSRPLALALDCHSGFGMRDRIWFPLAGSQRPIEVVGEIYTLKCLFDQAYPHHRYVFEPQSHQYLTHGDLWDYLYLQSRRQAKGLFLPLTLEMGSWNWVRKNPRQLLSRLGAFNPLAPHRQQRAMRTHLAFMDFLTRLAGSGDRWLAGSQRGPRHRMEAMNLWYRNGT